MIRPTVFKSLRSGALTAAIAAVAIVPSSASAAAVETTVEFNSCSSTSSTWTVPANVYALTVLIKGGGGGGGGADGSYSGGSGGSGGMVSGIISVTPGEVLSVGVGCKGANGQSSVTEGGSGAGGLSPFGAGGLGGMAGSQGASGAGGGGGGASGITVVRSATTYRLIAAGGGGGGGGASRTSGNWPINGYSYKYFNSTSAGKAGISRGNGDGGGGGGGGGGYPNGGYGGDRDAGTDYNGAAGVLGQSYANLPGVSTAPSSPLTTGPAGAGVDGSVKIMYAPYQRVFTPSTACGSSSTQWTVPADVSSIEAWVFGAGGGYGGDDVKFGRLGGPGSLVISSMSVTAGENFSYTLGCAGANGASNASGNGGGTAGAGAPSGGRGGNAGPSGSSGAGGGGGGGSELSVVRGGTSYGLTAAGGGGGAGSGSSLNGFSSQKDFVNWAGGRGNQGSGGAAAKAGGNGGDKSSGDGAGGGGGGGGYDWASAGAANGGSGGTVNANTDYTGNGGNRGLSGGSLGTPVTGADRGGGGGAAGTLAIVYTPGLPTITSVTRAWAGGNTSSLNNGGSPSFTFTFSRAVTGLALEDFFVTGPAEGMFCSGDAWEAKSLTGSGTTWTVTLGQKALLPNPSCDGRIDVGLLSNSVTDTALGTPGPVGVSGTNTVASGAGSNFFVQKGTPATPQITAGPTGPVSSTSASFSFTGEASATFECRLDGGSWSACTSPQAYSGLAEGEHTFQVRQTDTFGQTSTAGWRTWTVDTVAPTVSINSINGNPASYLYWNGVLTTRALSWGFSSEPGATFKCRIWGSPVTSWTAWADCTSPWSYTFSGDVLEGDVEVVAYDAAGNASQSAMKSFSIDTTPPSPPSITSFPPSLTNSTSATFAFSATDSDTASYVCSIDNITYSACTSPKTYTGLSDATRTFYVKAVDSAGNTSTAATKSWTVDTLAAAPSLSGAPASLTKVNTASISFSGESGATFQCSVDGGAYSSCTSPKSLGPLSDGAHSLSVKQTDPAGNVSTSATASWTVDTTAPAAPSITAKPTNPTKVTGASFSFTGEASATFECQLDSGSWGSCTSAKSYTGLAEGSHTFQVRQTDAAGNTGTAASWTWTVDTTPPVAPVLGGVPSALTSATSASITISGESGATFKCSVDGGSFTTCTSPVSLSGLADGLHSIVVTQTDAAGNTSPVSTATWTVDGVPATVTSFTTSSAALTSATTLTYEISFSKPVTGLAASDFTIGGTSTSWSVDSVTGTGAGPYTVTLKASSTPSDNSDGTVTLSLAAASGSQPVQTLAGVTSPTSAANAPTLTIDRTAPSAFTSDAGPVSKATSITYHVAFNEAVTGLALDDFAIGGTSTGWSIDSLTPSGDGYDLVVTATSATDGTLTVTLAKDAVLDGASNPGPSANVTTAAILIDQTPPAAPTFTNQPDSVTSLTSANFAWTGEEGATFECKLDTGSWAACTSPVPLSGLANGAHTYSVRQTDTAGNTGPAATVNWTVDTSPPPTPTFSSNPAALTNSTSATLAWSSPGAAYYRCAVDGGAYEDCNTPKGLTGLSEGNHTISVIAYNAGGFANDPAIASWTVDTTAPAAPAITAGPDDPTSQTSAAWSFTGESGATFECKLDGGSWGPCSSPKSYTGLADGSHTFQVRQTDAAGNTGPAANRTWKVDTTAPAAPTLTGAPAALTNSTSQNISWSDVVEVAGGAGSGIGFYECSVDGGSWTTCTSPQARSGLSEGAHSLAVRTVDNAGNRSTASTATWTVDTTAPAAPSITSKPTGTVASTSASLGFAGEPGGTFECKLDSSAWASCSSPRAYTGLSDGSHTFQVRQTDAAGNTGAATSTTWTVDSTAPAAPSITTKPATLTKSTTGAFSFTGEPGGSFQCKLDSGAWASCTSPASYSGLAEGSHTFQVRQTDAVGNTGAATSATWTVDTTAPAAPVITAKPAALTGSAAAAFSFTGEPGATFECRLDGGAWASCTSPRNYTGLANGSHTFQVRQTDAAGNTGAATSATWTVDTTAPAAPVFTAGPSATTTDPTATIAFTGEQGATLQCSFNNGAWKPCSTPFTATNIPPGNYSLAVRAIDGAGNVGAVATRSFRAACPVPVVSRPTQNLVADPSKANGYRWEVKPNARPGNNDARDACQLLTVQVSSNATDRKPDSAVPVRPFKLEDGVISFSSLVFSHYAIQPVWLRAGNKVGGYSDWVLVGSHK